MKSYIILTGGELFNKGAQAMTFTAISELKRKYPNQTIVLLSRKDFERDTLDKNKYNFKILPWNLAIKSYLLRFPYSTIAKIKNRKKYLEFNDYFAEIEKIFSSCSMLIDISGYSLSSQNMEKSVFGYISNIIVAKKYNIDTWLFPQSFGPFKFKGVYSIFNRKLIVKYLSYVKQVFVREKNGYDSLMDFTKNKLNNVKLMPDIVLQSKSNYNFEAIFKANIQNKVLNIVDNSVAIVPNMQVVKRIQKNQMIELYKNIITELIKKNRTVYILRHSTEDLTICREIKNSFRFNENVKIIDDDYSCIALENIINKFKYIIGSRYHSIVHAYKNGVPAIAIGWAIKYEELLNRFGQGKFKFDIRKNVNVKEIINAIQVMENEFNEESTKIKDVLKEIQKNDVFEYVRNYYKKTVIDTTVKNNLCLSCGICESVCPQQCITLELGKGQFTPTIDFSKCIRCGICSDICSAHRMEFHKFAQINNQKLNINWFIGNHFNCYNGYAFDKKIRMNSTSGGLITAIVKECLDLGYYDRAFLVDDFKYENVVETKEYQKNCDLNSSSKSRYIPISHKRMVDFVLKNREKKIIVVATSCVVHTFMNVINQYKLERYNYLILGLFCDRTFNQNIYKYFRDYSKADGRLENLYFRTKEQIGWPGNIKLEFVDGSSLFLGKKERIKIKEYFEIERCLYCIDKLNQFADLSFGDNYTKQNADGFGSNSIIVRTEKGREILYRLSKKFKLSDVEIGLITKSQKIKEKELNLQFAENLFLIKGINLYPGLIKKEKMNAIDGKILKQLNRRKNRIEIGRNYPITRKKLKRNLMISNTKDRLKIIVKRLIKL